MFIYFSFHNITSRVPINKKIRLIYMYDEIMMKSMIKSNYDEIGVKTAAKCLAHMKGSWDQEFVPGVEESVDYR